MKQKNTWLRIWPWPWESLFAQSKATRQSLLCVCVQQQLYTYTRIYNEYIAAGAAQEILQRALN